MSNARKFSSANCYVFGFVLDGEGGGSVPKAPEARDKPLWLHIDYSEKDSEAWLEKLGVPAKVVESMVRLDTRPRTMVLEQGVLIILRVINANPGQRPEDMVSLRIWIEKNRVITVRQRKVFIAQKLKEDLETGKGPGGIQELVNTIIEGIADSIADFVDTAEGEIGAFEQSSETAEVKTLRAQVSELRREIARIRRYLAPQREALDAFARQAKAILDADHAYLIHEQSDRIVRYLEDLDLIRERSQVLQDELLNRVAQEQNARMYMLSIVAAIFLPITFVTGLFGMNVAGLPGVENPWAFPILALFMLAVISGTLLFFRSRRWL